MTGKKVYVIELCNPLVADGSGIVAGKKVYVNGGQTRQCGGTNRMQQNPWPARAMDM